MKKYEDQIRSVVVCYGVFSIGKSAFFRCLNLRAVALLISVTSIKDGAFASCGFSSIKIPSSVISLGENPFYECENLEVIDVSENQNFVFVEEVLMDKEMTQIIFCIKSKSGDYTIPSTVTTIREWTFCGCGKLTSIVIPNSVTSIGESAFAFCCSLKTVSIPKQLEYPTHAFPWEATITKY